MKAGVRKADQTVVGLTQVIDAQALPGDLRNVASTIASCPSPDEISTQDCPKAQPYEILYGRSFLTSDMLFDSEI